MVYEDIRKYDEEPKKRRLFLKTIAIFAALAFIATQVNSCLTEKDEVINPDQTELPVVQNESKDILFK